MTHSSAFELPHFVTVDELAHLIKRNKFTIYHWLKDAPERLPRVTKVHGRVLFLAADVKSWFASVTWGEAVPTSAPAKRGARTKVERAARRQREEASQ